MWEDLLNFGEGAWESISEGAAQVVDSFVDAQVTNQQEAAKDPEVLNQLEPEKGTRTDGSTIVETPAPRTLINGVDNTWLLVGGAVLLVGVVALARGGR